jgi:hypothetical protein
MSKDVAVVVHPVSVHGGIGTAGMSFAPAGDNYDTYDENENASEEGAMGWRVVRDVASGGLRFETAVTAASDASEAGVIGSTWNVLMLLGPT